MRKGWTEATLGDVAKLSIGRTPPRRESRYWTDELTNPFCTIADLSTRIVIPSREGVTEAAIREGRAKLSAKGTLLMSFKLTLGRVGFAGRDLYPNEAIASIAAYSSVALDEYLYYLLGFQDLSAGSGLAVKGVTLNSKSLSEIALLLPPVIEQRRIVDLMLCIDSYIERLASTSAEADAGESLTSAALKLRTALLQELLSGSHEIPDSYDRFLGAV